jgi:hypothetical protein
MNSKRVNYFQLMVFTFSFIGVLGLSGCIPEKKVQIISTATSKPKKDNFSELVRITKQYGLEETPLTSDDEDLYAGIDVTEENNRTIVYSYRIKPKYENTTYLEDYRKYELHFKDVARRIFDQYKLFEEDASSLTLKIQEVLPSGEPVFSMTFSLPDGVVETGEIMDFTEEVNALGNRNDFSAYIREITASHSQAPVQEYQDILTVKVTEGSAYTINIDYVFNERHYLVEDETTSWRQLGLIYANSLRDAAAYFPEVKLGLSILNADGSPIGHFNYTLQDIETIQKQEGNVPGRFPFEVA